MSKNALILIVDDTTSNVQILGNILIGEGYDVACVTSWTEAEEFLSEEIPDLILMDVMMPKVNGFEACRIIKSNEKTKSIPLIFISALMDIEDKVQGFNAGGVDYISKPFQREDVLMRIQTHLSLKRAEEELRLINVSKDMFLSIIAHDLKNPVTSIIGLVDLMKIKIQKGDMDGVKAYTENVDKSINLLASFMENILSWALIQKNGMEFQPKEINVKKLVRECIEIHRNLFESKEIKVVEDVKDFIKIFCDENMFKTVIRNLVSNAIKYTNIKGEISIKAKVTDKVCIEIQDNGVGMSEDTLGKLFKIEEKHTTEGTMKERGTGLGLIMSKELIEKNGGSVLVESEEGKGTTFKVIMNY